MKPKFFSTPEKFRNWLERFHESKTELWVGFYKKATGRKSITWPESVDQALCFGWIDGIRKRIDDQCYMIRFTPRRSNSTWSTVNIRRIAELKNRKLVHAAGLAAFKRQTKSNSNRYSYEQANVKLDPRYESQIRADSQAWKYFQSLAASYKKPSIWWVMSAKQPKTQLSRLRTLIACCKKGERIPTLVNRPVVRKKK